MGAPRTALFTVGYEGRALDELIAVLQGSDVDCVIDIRALPLSRRRGFSKTPLGHALRDAGIDYVHLRSAGNPFRREDDALAKYGQYVRGADDVVDAVAAAARGRRAALLCYEAEPETCHRSLLAPRVAAALRCTIRDL